MRFLVLVLVLVFSFYAQAEEAVLTPAPTPPPEPSKWEQIKETATDKAKDLHAAMNEIRENRASTKWSVLGDYSLFETWVLSKYGWTLAYNTSPSLSYELEYMKGSLGWGYFGIDIGKISEQKATLLRRSFNQRNTFSFITGVYYSKFDVHLGSDLLATVSGSEQANVNLVELATLGVTWGVGNRWQTKKGYVWGADWFVVNLPLATLNESTPFVNETSSQERRDQVNNAMKLFKHVPTLAVVKIQVGFSF